MKFCKFNIPLTIETTLYNARHFVYAKRGNIFFDIRREGESIPDMPLSKATENSQIDLKSSPVYLEIRQPKAKIILQKLFGSDSQAHYSLHAHSSIGGYHVISHSSGAEKIYGNPEVLTEVLSYPEITDFIAFIPKKNSGYLASYIKEWKTNEILSHSR